MARISFSMARVVPMLLIGVLVILNVAVQAMGWMGKGFATPDNALWPGPVMPGKQFALDDPARARVVGGAASTPAPAEKPKEKPPVVAKAEPAPVKPPPAAAPSPPPPPIPASPEVTVGKFVVQVGSFALNMGVDSLIEKLKKHGMNPRVETVQDRVSLNNVQAGPFKSLEAAKEAEARLKAGGFPAQVEENWEGFIISLGRHLLLGHALEEKERVRLLGVGPLRMVKTDTDLSVRKILLGPYETKERALTMSAKVAELGIAVPVLKTWPLSNALP